ncbi:MAG: N-acetylneuraminate synthase family protein [Butyrivibrio sp.]|nr:N-acetylneuraminate synthase family protein [Ruminococcus flavefaciens]MCM1559160.1 N-acetylneuraminate synthase family protein [Butyrivibrio sp.]
MFQRGNQCYVIAEIGGNFTDYETAKLLIDQAKASGVDAVKLQTYRASTISSRQAIFDMENLNAVSQKDYFKKFEIDEELHKKVYCYAKEKGLDIFSTPSHISDVELLERLGTNVYKIGADDLTNLPFLKEIAKLHKPIMLSTGMSTLEEVKDAVNAILEEGNGDIVIMHVVSLYPTAPQYVNLEALRTLQQTFPQFTIGYSDHTLSVDACIFAAVMGAKVIEKHFTYDKKADGPDHMLSATKEEMKLLVEKIRLYEQMKGTGIKMPMGDEVKNRRNNRKSIVCVRDVKAGETLSEADIDIKRPGFGLSPKYRDMLIGKKAARDIMADTLLYWSDFE